MLLLVKSENKSCLQVEQRDDYQADTVWATCQHYTVKTPFPIKVPLRYERLMQHLDMSLSMHKHP